MRRRSTNLMILCLASLMLAACSLPRGAALQSEVLREADADTPSFAVVEVTRDAMARVGKWPVTGWSGTYNWINGGRGPSSPIIRAGDKIDLVIWDSQDNSLLTSIEQKTVGISGLQVAPDGTIFVPYVGDVVVSGSTPAAARQTIQSQLEPIVPSAQVVLTMTEGQENSADLVGGVSRPGTYPLPNRNYTILSLIAQGGGVSPALKNPTARLIRNGKTYTIPVEDLFSHAGQDTILRGNDKVIIEDDKRYFTALGASGVESMIQFPKQKVTALEALSLMGGLADARADPKGVLVLREYEPGQVRADGSGPPMQQVIFTFDMTTADGLFAARKFQVNPGDTVLATESPIVKAQTIMGLFGGFLGFGQQLRTAAL